MEHESTRLSLQQAGAGRCVYEKRFHQVIGGDGDYEKNNPVRVGDHIFPRLKRPPDPYRFVPAIRVNKMFAHRRPTSLYYNVAFCLLLIIGWGGAILQGMGVIRAPAALRVRY